MVLDGFRTHTGHYRSQSFSVVESTLVFLAGIRDQALSSFLHFIRGTGRVDQPKDYEPKDHDFRRCPRSRCFDGIRVPVADMEVFGPWVSMASHPSLSKSKS